MLRTIFLSIATLLVTALGPLRADPAPQGQFMLGTYIWPDTLLPRYATLHIDGAKLTLSFSSALPLNFEECDATGDCLYEVDAATASVTLDNGRLSLTNVTIDRAAKIETGFESRNGKPASDAYTAPLMALLAGATLHPEPTGFRLDTGAVQLAFYRGDDTAFAAARAVPLIYELSIAKMSACEVRTTLPLFQTAAPDAAETLSRNILRGFVKQHMSYNEKRRLAPYGGTPTPQDRARARQAQIAAQLPTRIANDHPEPGTDYIEPFWETLGSRMFRDDRAAYDAALATYGETLDDLVAFQRHLRATRTTITVPAVCADPLLGFGG